MAGFNKRKTFIQESLRVHVETTSQLVNELMKVTCLFPPKPECFPELNQVVFLLVSNQTPTVR